MCDCCSALEKRIKALEKFSNQVTPDMDARQVIYLWFQTHLAVNAASLAYEVGKQGPTYTAIRQRLYHMHKEGVLVKVGLGSYRKLI